MDLGISPDAIAQAGGQISSAVGPTFWVMVLLAVGTIVGKIYISWGDRLQVSGLLSNASGVGLIGVSIVFLVGGIFLTDREVRTWVMIRQNIVDPFIVTVLRKDSCSPHTNRFCVVAWDPDGREVVVNWHDKRVDAFELYNDLDLTLFTSARPKSRPAPAQS